MTLPELAPAHWYPQSADYLAFSFDTAATFGPADVSAIKRWAELLMVTGPLIALALATLASPAPGEAVSDAAPQDCGHQG